MAIRADVGIIGGTGIADRLATLGGKQVHVPTSEGYLRGRLLEHAGKGVLLIQRHSAGHKTPPHHVNYKAMALGLQALGAKYCLATAAVGSLHEDWGPGTFAVCSDFIDLTFRNFTLFENRVEHRDFSHPMGDASREALLRAATVRQLIVKSKAVYVAANGPRYETPAEVQHAKQIGGDVVGMTAASEAVLMREAHIDYACLSIVTNLAAGISSAPLDHQEVVDEMKTSGEKAVTLLLQAVALL